jgi:hypothetical protein
MGYIVLQREQVLVGPIVARRPLCAVVGRVDEFRADAHDVPFTAHTALDQVCNPEFGTDVTAIIFAIPELKRGSAADDLEARKLRKPGDQIFRQPIGEVLLLRIAALVGQRQYRNGCAGGWQHRPGRKRRDWRLGGLGASEPIDTDIRERGKQSRRDRAGQDALQTPGGRLPAFDIRSSRSLSR